MSIEKVKEKAIEDVNHQLSDALGKSLLKEAKRYRSAVSPVTAESLLQKEVKFYNQQGPTLKEGRYEIKAWQKIITEEATEYTPEIVQQLLVSGPRYGVSLKDINSVFPPVDSSGGHSTTLPHLAFDRTSLPWEVGMKGNESTAAQAGGPWFCLLLFDEEATPEIQQSTLKELNLSIPDGFATSKKVNIIAVPQDLFPSDSKLLCHSREKSGKELSFVVGHRFPKNNAKSTVHLVSLKDTLPNNHYISLFHWSFECKNDRPNFKALLEKNTVKPFHFEHSRMNDYYREGYVPLPNFLRDGRQTVSLYRGPLLPYPRQELTTVFNTDKQYIFMEEGVEMADVSRGAAFQFGQLQVVANKRMANTIFNWKRSIYRQQKQQQFLTKEEQSFYRTHQKVSIPSEILSWIKELMQLGSIPFNYLIPYEQMLPENSVRFFQLDKEWIQSCLEGAFSVGEEYFHLDSIADLLDKSYTGFILRNEVVKDYPELTVSAYVDREANHLATLYFQRSLGEDMTLYCFEEEIKTVDLFLPAEAMHFGVEKIANGGLQKKLRNSSTEPVLLDESLLTAHRSLKLNTFKEKMKITTSAEFAYHMVEGSPKVRVTLI